MSQIVHETIKVKEATNRSIEVEARLASKKLATYLEVAKNAPICKQQLLKRMLKIILYIVVSIVLMLPNLNIHLSS